MHDLSVEVTGQPVGVGPPTMWILELKLRLLGKCLYLLGPPTDLAGTFLKVNSREILERLPRVLERISMLLPDVADRSLFQIIHYNWLLLSFYAPMENHVFLLPAPCPCDTLCSSDSLLFLRV